MSPRLLRAALALLPLLALAANPADAKREPYESRKIEVLGAKRSFLVEMDPAAEKPRPAIFLLHGEGDRPDSFRSHIDLDLVARGWAAIYPRALKAGWNNGRVGPDNMPLRKSDDVEYLRTIIETLVSEGEIDPARIFFAGFGGGGFMVARLVCDMPELVAGAAIVAATHPAGYYCVGDRPVPTLYFHGLEDRSVPFYGEPVHPKHRLDKGEAAAAPHTLELAALRNGCSGYADLPKQNVDPEDGTAVTRRIYSLCAAPLIQYIIEGGGHTWPGTVADPKTAKTVGATSREVNATAEIEALFEALAARR